MEVDEMAPTENCCTKCSEEIKYQVNLSPVHWIRKNMLQWCKMCSDFSSADPVRQQAAYRDLLVQNSRYPKEVPSGMMCTLNFIKARLQDKMFVAHIVENNLSEDVEVLRNMYMTAIQEFLEILGSMNQYSIGIYPLSKKFNLPDWLVDIYHEMCHQNKKPTINNLRAATHLCIDWLHEHYWLNESKMAATWVKLETKVKQDLQQMVDFLAKCLVHYFNGNRVINSIPEEELRNHVEDKYNRYGLDELLSMRQRLVENKILAQNDISISLLVLVKDITEYIKKDNFIHATEKLAEVLVENSCFLPSKMFLSSLESLKDDTELHLPHRFLKVWNGIMEFLPQNEFIPILLDKLLEVTHNEQESDERREVASIWVKTLAGALLAVHNTLQYMKQNPSAKNVMYIRMIFNSRLISVGEVFLLRPQFVPNQLQQSSNLVRLLQTPNKWTRIYLQNLMMLLEPRLPHQMEILLNELLCIYTNENIQGFSVEEFTVHSAEDLNSILMQSSKSADMIIGEEQQVPWVHDLEKWGSDPPHHELKLLTDDLPNASLWQSDTQV